MNKDLHPLQMQILKKLLFSQSLRYTELKPTISLENNQFDFHLDKLIKAAYIIKQENLYLLTSIGKEFANRMDTDQTKIAIQAKISVFVAATKKIRGSSHYLIYTRLKQPFYGKQGFLSGKVLYGESVKDAAIREFFEETNLTGNPQIIAIQHYRVYEKYEDNLVEDKFMFYCLIKNPKGKLKGSAEGKYEWVKETDLYSFVKNHFESIKRFKKNIEYIKKFNGQIHFEEITQITDKF